MQNDYAALVLASLPASLGDQRQQLCQQFIRKCPTPFALKKASRVEREQMLSWAPEMATVFAAIELGQQVAKSHQEIIGHAYSSVELGREMVAHFQGEEQERICVACTDVHNDIIAWKTLFVGGRSECVLYPDRIFNYALRNSARGIIMIHNHPSGDIEPSDQDYSFTQRLDHGCDIIGLQLVDFMIVGRDKYYSWREERCI